jgi:hypothetical protein
LLDLRQLGHQHVGDPPAAPVPWYACWCLRHGVTLAGEARLQVVPQQSQQHSSTPHPQQHAQPCPVAARPAPGIQHTALCLARSRVAAYVALRLWQEHLLGAGGACNLPCGALVQQPAADTTTVAPRWQWARPGCMCACHAREFGRAGPACEGQVRCWVCSTCFTAGRHPPAPGAPQALGSPSVQ